MQPLVSYVVLTLHSIMFLCSLIAFAVWAGAIEANITNRTVGTHAYGVGFAFVVINFIASIVVLALLAIRRCTEGASTQSRMVTSSVMASARPNPMNVVPH